MVRPESQFLVDTAFIVERAHKMFSGTAPLQDNLGR